MAAKNQDSLAMANKMKFTVPISLFLIVFLYETWEHIILTGKFKVDFHWTMEILFFGVFGPSLVFYIFSFVINLLQQEILNSSKLEKLNKELEEEVRKRTKNLAKRNKELANANKELKVLDDLKSDFVALVSHELSGPLTTLHGGIELALQKKNQLRGKLRKILEVMEKESNRLIEFVYSILDIQRIEAGELNLSLGSVEIAPLLDHIVPLLTSEEKREIVLNVPPNLPSVWADEGAIEKIICNLLTNAIKYSDKSQPVFLDLDISKKNIAITITDFGNGIASADLDLIFERFRRLPESELFSAQGWGLGLYFARVLAKAQNCTLTVVSPAHDHSEKPGSAFTLSIPISQNFSAHG